MEAAGFWGSALFALSGHTIKIKPLARPKQVATSPYLMSNLFTVLII